MASDDDDVDGQGLRNRETDIVRRNQRRYESRDEEDSSSGDSYDEDYSDDQQDEEDEWEAALVEKALYRINKAQAKGRTDVRLSKEEIKALERRQQRMEAEERRNRRRGQERVAIPLSQFGSMARLGGSESGSNPVSRQPSGSETHDEISPQMGYFPPPSGSRPRPKSTISTSRPTSFHEEPSRDPFKYQTAGSRAAKYAAPKRHGSGQSDLSSMSRQGRPESVSEWSRQGSSRRQSSDDTSEELALVEERSNRTESSSRTAKGREEIVVEVEVESPSGPERAPSRTRSTTRKKSDPAPTRRTVSSRTGTGTSGASAGVRRKKRE